MDKTIKINAYAKINPYLDVVSRRDDGYHELRGVMQQISLCDTLEVSLGEGFGREYTLEIEYEGEAYKGNFPPLSTGADNLCIRAADAFARAWGMENLSVKINLTKRIPAAAGLGGGSADAAAVLSALNELCRFPFDKNQLCGIGVKLGADVPFCVTGGACEASGTGSRLSPCPPLPDCTVLAAITGVGISTPKAYAQLDERFDGFYNHKPNSGYEPFKKALANRDLSGIAANMYNIFEETVLSARSDVSELKRIMIEYGAAGTLLSGSGPAVFGIFTDEENARTAGKIIEKTGAAVYLCRPI